MKMVNGSFVKERESLSCCDWFSMKLHEMMFRIKTFFDSDNNFHYEQRIKRRATYLLRTFIHIKSLKFSFGLSAQPRAIEFLWQNVWVNLAEEFFGEISKPLTSKDLAFVAIRTMTFTTLTTQNCGHTILKNREKKTSKYKSEGNFSHIRKLLLILA